MRRRRQGQQVVSLPPTRLTPEIPAEIAMQFPDKLQGLTSEEISPEVLTDQTTDQIPGNDMADAPKETDPRIEIIDNLKGEVLSIKRLMTLKSSQLEPDRMSPAVVRNILTKCDAILRKLETLR